ncbi:MAG: HDIG domain-containing protein [Bacteroidaceae bacterium]|nr:HDIG domain-containing protein [Bacteroidaceae bacterium]
MSRNNTPHNLTWKDYLIHFTVLAAVTTLLVWAMPRGSRTTMSTDVGRPWPYGLLIAPFDFPIFKTDAQLQHERDSIRLTYEPYFAIHDEVEGQQVARFKADFRQRHAATLPMAYRTYVEQRLREVYARGLVATDDYDRLHADSTRAIRIFEGTEVRQSRAVATLFTQKTAYEYLLSATADSIGINRQPLQRMDLQRFLRPNITYDEEKSQALWAQLSGSLSPSSGMVLAGEKIIDRGDIVDEPTFQKLESYERATAARGQTDHSERLTLMGQVFFVVIIVAALAIYFHLFRQDYIVSLRSTLLLIILIMAFPAMTSFLVRHTLLSVYIIPYAMLPVFVRVFMDSRTAFTTHVAVVMLSAVALKYPFEFIATELVAGMVAIFTLRELSERSQIIRTAILVTLAAWAVFFSIELMHGKFLTGADSVRGLDWSIYKHIAASGLLLLFAYPLMAALERLFGFTSNVTLVELSNINRPLLHRLSEVAPGTFQHSMQVSNLAAEVARKIGAKSQLVRTGALYHDIGKMYNPPFFTENQAGGVNPHDSLDPRESARIIIRHVAEGEALADKYQLPHIIREFITSHHGHGLVKYFYITYRNRYPDREVDEADFTYPGHNPATTEQAILMMADAVEASSRSLKEYTEQSIAELVDRIIDAQVADGLFRECPITFLDIQTAKEVFKEKLKTIYHTRISYPKLKG